MVSVAVLLLSAGCTGAADSDTSVSPTDVVEDPTDIATVIASVVAPPGIFDEERERGIDALNLRESLGPDGEAILSLLASSEDGARAASPAFSWPTVEGPEATEPEGLRSGFAAAIGAPPPDAEVRDALPGALDNVGRGNGAIHQGPDTTTATETAGGRSATTTTTTTWDGSIQGSVVELTVRREVHSVITGPDGSTLLDKTDRYAVTVRLDVCPTVAGLVLGTVDHDNSQDATVTPAPGAASAHAASTLTAASSFQGTVDDAANLGNVSQDYVHDEHWTRTGSADGDDDVDDGTFTLTAAGVGDGVPAPREWSIAIGDWSNAITPESIQMSEDVSLATSLTHAMVTAALDYNTIDQAYIEAQRLWRNGRCVMVTAPDYGAETPLEVSQQSSVQHTEEVDTSSTTTFGTDVKHRFGGSVTAPINADLTGGKETLTPGSISPPPGDLTYEAPAEDDQTATVLLVSTSKQGIGRLVLEFHTQTPGWTFNGDTPLGTVRGLKCDGLGGEWMIVGDGMLGPMTVTSTRSIVIDAATLTGTSDFTEVATSPVSVATTTVTAAARIVVNADGSVTMEIDAAPTTLTTTNSFGGAGTVTIPGQALTFPWQTADAEACP